MKKKNTDGLQQELMDSPDLSQFLSQNQEQFENKSVAELLNLCGRTPLTRSGLVRIRENALRNAAPEEPSER